MKSKRRNRLDLNTTAELAIRKAIDEVKKIGEDVKLTIAVIKLSEAKELVADFIDSIDGEEDEEEEHRIKLPESESNYER